MSESCGSLVPVLAHRSRCGRAPLFSEALRAVRVEEVAIRVVGALGDRDAELGVQLRGHLAGHGAVPAADEDRGHRAHVGIEPGGDAPLDAAHVGIRGGDIVLAREEQRHVDGHPREDGLLDGGQALARAGDLDEEVRPPRARVELLGLGEGARGVVREERRDLERHEAVHAVGRVMDGAEEVGGLGQVLDGQLEEELLARLARGDLLLDARVVVRALADGLVEDGGVRGEPADAELVDVALERAAGEELAGDVVEPQALAGLAERERW